MLITLLGVCISVDLALPGAYHSKNFIHYGQSVGLTSFIPPFYLFIIWIQTEPPFISYSYLRVWRARLAKIMPPRRPTSKNFFLNVLIIYGVSVPLSYFLPGLIYVVGTGIPFTLYSLDKIYNSFAREHQHHKR